LLHLHELERKHERYEATLQAKEEERAREMQACRGGVAAVHSTRGCIHPSIHPSIQPTNQITRFARLGVQTTIPLTNQNIASPFSLLQALHAKHDAFAAELTDAHGAERSAVEAQLAEVEDAERRARREHLRALEEKDEAHQAAVVAEEEQRRETMDEFYDEHMNYVAEIQEAHGTARDELEEKLAVLAAAEQGLKAYKPLCFHHQPERRYNVFNNPLSRPEGVQSTLSPPPTRSSLYEFTSRLHPGLRASHAVTLEEKDEAHKAAVAAEAEQRREALEAVKDLHRRNMAELTDAHSATLDDLKTKLEEVRASEATAEQEHVLALADHREHVEGLKESAEKEELEALQRRNDDHALAVAATVDAHSDAMFALHDKHADKLAALRAKHDEDVAALHESHGSTHEALEANMVELEAAEAEARARHTLALKDKDQAHQAAVAAKEDERRETMDKFHDEHTSYVAEIHDAHGTARDELEAQLAALESAETALRDNHAVTLKEKDEAHQAVVAAEDRARHDEMDAFYDEHMNYIAELQASHSDEHDAWEAELESLQREAKQEFEVARDEAQLAESRALEDRAYAAAEMLEAEEARGLAREIEAVRAACICGFWDRGGISIDRPTD